MNISKLVTCIALVHFFAFFISVFGDQLEVIDEKTKQDIVKPFVTVENKELSAAEKVRKSIADFQERQQLRKQQAKERAEANRKRLLELQEELKELYKLSPKERLEKIKEKNRKLVAEFQANLKAKQRERQSALDKLLGKTKEQKGTAEPEVTNNKTAVATGADAINYNVTTLGAAVTDGKTVTSVETKGNKGTHSPGGKLINDRLDQIKEKKQKLVADIVDKANVRQQRRDEALAKIHGKTKATKEQVKEDIKELVKEDIIKHKDEAKEMVNDVKQVKEDIKEKVDEIKKEVKHIAEPKKDNNVTITK